jgi:uncharacterized protein YecA (UPF0149 family)
MQETAVKLPSIVEAVESRPVRLHRKPNAFLAMFRTEQAHREFRIPRNAACPCGSGKKYKKCCGGPDQ